jgi:hypothetical protein
VQGQRTHESEVVLQRDALWPPRYCGSQSFVML